MMLDFSISDATAIENFLTSPCCGESITCECSIHFLTPDFLEQLRKKVEADKTSTTAKIVAELAKQKSCREYINDNAIITILVQNLDSLDEELIFQSCRALANLCYDFDSAATFIVKQGAIESLNKLLQKFKFETEKEKQIISAVAGLLCNLITDDCEDGNFLPLSMRNRLLDLMQRELETGEVTWLSHRLMTIFVNLATCTEDKTVFSPTVCQLAVDLLKISEDAEFFSAAMTYLADSSIADEVKLRLAQAGLVEYLVTHVDNLRIDDKENWDLVGRVLANIIAGDEALKYIDQNSPLNLLDRISDWLNSDQYHVILFGAKCLANYGCCDKTCAEIIERNLHKPIMAALARNDCDVFLQHAVLGTLRNLAVAEKHKKRLVADGILQALNPLIALDIENSAQIIYQLINVWRKLALGGTEIATVIGMDSKLVSKVVVWSQAGCPWIMFEAPRLLCELIVRSKERSVAVNLHSCKGFQEIINLLTSEHEIMHLEAVLAIAVAALYFLENPSGWDVVLVDADIATKINSLVTMTTSLHLMDNIISMIEVLFKYDKIRLHLQGLDVVKTITTTITSNEGYSSLINRLKSSKIN